MRSDVMKITFRYYNLITNISDRMTNLSVKQRMVVHLERYKSVSPNEEYNLPWDMTQDGIATALLISRAHTSIELKNLRDKGLVTERLAHVKGGRNKRKIYYLTKMGIKEAEKIRMLIERNILQMGGPERSPSNENTDIGMDCADPLGCACVLRAPLPKDLLPGTNAASVRTDGKGMIEMDRQSRESIMRTATEDQKRRWHSMAADMWLDYGGRCENTTLALHERLHHLISAGREIDACRLVSSRYYDLVSSSNEDLHNSLKRLNDVPDRFAGDVLKARIETDRDCMDIGDMEYSINRLEGIDPVMSQIYKTDLAACKGEHDKAMNILSNMDGTPIVTMRMANAMIERDMLKEAKELLSAMDPRSCMNSTELNVEKYILMAKLDKKEGHDSDAYAHLMKAMASVNDFGKGRIESILRSMDLRM